MDKVMNNDNAQNGGELDAGWNPNPSNPGENYNYTLNDMAQRVREGDSNMRNNGTIMDQRYGT